MNFTTHLLSKIFQQNLPLKLKIGEISINVLFAYKKENKRANCNKSKIFHATFRTSKKSCHYLFVINFRLYLPTAIGSCSIGGCVRHVVVSENSGRTKKKKKTKR